jgi:hypothetical protein
MELQEQGISFRIKPWGEKNMRVDLLCKLLFHFLFERHALALEDLPGSGMLLDSVKELFYCPIA